MCILTRRWKDLFLLWKIIIIIIIIFKLESLFIFIYSQKEK